MTGAGNGKLARLVEPAEYRLSPIGHALGLQVLLASWRLRAPALKLLGPGGRGMNGKRWPHGG